MLLSLHVKNLAIIEEEEIEFGRGLNILSGETGAGKSIILGALGLAMGKKPSKGILRDDSKDALAEAVFSINKSQKTLLEKMDIDVSEDEVILQRKITPTRAVAKINGESVPSSMLSKVAEVLIDVYGQHEQQTLLSKKNHIALVDEFSGEHLLDKKRKLAEIYDRYKSLLKEYEEGNLDVSQRAREIELLRHEISEIESAKIRPGEDEELKEEYKKLSQSEKIAEAIGEALNALGDDVSENIGRAIRGLNSISELDEKITDYTEALADAESILAEAQNGIMSYAENLDTSREQLIQVSDRIDLLDSLKRRFSKTGILEDIHICLDENKKKLEKLENYDAYIEGVKKQLDELKDALYLLCQEVSDIRKKSAKELEKKVNDALIDLNFTGSGLDIRIDKLEEAKRTGIDEVSFYISTNQGEQSRPLDEIASGGELSRIMLAIKTIFADMGEIDTLVFDEIDSGIGGSTAAKVAERLSSLSGNSQVICITHLPQIASRANTHFLIEKMSKDGMTISSIRQLNDEEKLLEVARMLAGDNITNAALENAKMLMK